MKIKLDKYEKEVLDAVENGKVKRVRAIRSEKYRYQKYARRTLSKSRNINIRL